MLWWEPYYVFYFAVCIKYIIPFALWFLLLFSIQSDIDNGYGGYSWHWQLAGLVVPISGIITFGLLTCCCLQEVELDEAEFSVTFTPEEIGEYRKLQGDEGNLLTATVAPEPKGAVELAKVEN